MREEPVQEEQHGDLKRRGGRELRKQNVKQEVSPEPVITIGKGKRKRVGDISFLTDFLS